MRPRRLPDVLALSGWLLPVIDILIVGLSANVAAFLLFYLRGDYSVWPLNSSYQVGVTFALALTPLTFYRLTLYRSHRGENLAMELTQVTGGWLTVLLVLAVIAIATKTGATFSRAWMFAWFLIGAFMFWVQRIGMRAIFALLRAQGWDTRNIVMVGAGPEATRVMRHLSQLRGLDTG